MIFRKILCFVFAVMLFMSPAIVANAAEEKSLTTLPARDKFDSIADFPIRDLGGIQIKPDDSLSKEDGKGFLDPSIKFPTTDDENDEPISNLPEEYCMRDEYIIYAQHQDKHGYCWNFASTMAASTTIMKATGEYYDFSEAWNAIGCYYFVSGFEKLGTGGTFSYQNTAIHTTGLMLECDLPYQTSYTTSNENAADYYNFYSQYANDDLASCLVYNSKTSNFKTNEVDKIKQHIYEHGSIYMTFTFKTGFVEEDGVFALPPNQTDCNSNHAVAVIGWDDNYEREFYLNGSDTPTVFKGAWIILNSYTESNGTDGISLVFYDDNNIGTIQGYRYEADTDKDLYFYDKIESGYAYPTSVKGKYYKDHTAEDAYTKQKNIFYDDVNLEYSYLISDGASVKNIGIYLDNTDVTNLFNVSIDHAANRFCISADDVSYGQYKVLVTYGNSESSDTYLNNFFVTHGLVGEEIEYDCDENKLSFNTGKHLEYYSYTTSGKNYIIYTDKLNGSVSLISSEQSVYSEKNMAIPTIFYEITDGKSCTVSHTITSDSGYSLNYNFTFEYCEDTSLSPVNVYYDLDGGINNPNNYNKELASASTDLVLYAPTREGYTFAGWYLDYGNGSKKLEQLGDLYYIDWDDIHHMGESPTLNASSYYKKYYNNSNIVFVYAHWEEIDYHDIELKINGNGSSQVSEKISVSNNDCVNYLLIPEKGYCLSDLKINGTSLGPSELVEIVNKGLLLQDIDTDTVIEATFSAGTYVNLTLGENIKDVYLTKTYQGQTFTFHNGDFIPATFFGATYANYFTLVVEVEDDIPGYTYVPYDVDSYDTPEKCIFTKSISISKGKALYQKSVESATAKPIQSVEISYKVTSILVLDHYISEDINATRGNQFSGVYNAGEVVYLFVKKPADTNTKRYYLSEDFIDIGGNWFRKGIYVNADSPKLGTLRVFSDDMYYHVTFRNWDGSVIEENDYLYNELPEYTNKNADGKIEYPTRPDDEIYSYTFIGWDKEITNVTENVSYTAVFIETPKQYTVTVENYNNGTVAPSGDNTLTYFDTLTYVFTPKEGYKIGDVIINGTSLGAISSYTFSKTTSNQNICVEFEKIKHSISILVGNGGTTDVNGTVEVDDKATLNINITPNEKFRINSIKINGIDTQISKTLTIVDISGNILVEIAFEQFEFSITTSYIGKGSVTPSVTVKPGNDAEIEFSADKGYEISRVSVNGEDVVFTDNKLLIENVRCDIDIVVVFEKNDTYAAVTFVSVSAFLVFGAILYTVRITKIRKKRK